MHPFSKKDLAFLKSQGISRAKALSEWHLFQKNPDPLILRPCRINEGILTATERQQKFWVAKYESKASRLKMVKFVPASGEGSRMFAAPFSWLKEYGPFFTEADLAMRNDVDADCVNFFENVERFAFAKDLKKTVERDGKVWSTLLKEGRYGEILQYLLTPKGLNYLHLPKGMIPFYIRDKRAQTAFEEHLEEALFYVKAGSSKARVHFTLAPEQKERVGSFFQKLLKKRGDLSVDFSVQSKGTQTITLNPDNTLFRNEKGNPLLRAGGHGALLSNLSALAKKFEMIFIKNIDNVPRNRETTAFHKKVLAGILLEGVQGRDDSLRLLLGKEIKKKQVEGVFRFLKTHLGVRPPDSLKKQGLETKKQYLIHRLNRPLRVCGVVKNEGAPGGGPFWVKEKDGTWSRQIVESSQAVTAKQKRIFARSTHFNPVDLLCWVRDKDGKPFDLHKFVDQDTSFIADKTHQGRALKALELPGLWNGSMAFWNTVFVEVPGTTFCPVKTVFDLLLRPDHQQDA